MSKSCNYAVKCLATGTGTDLLAIRVTGGRNRFLPILKAVNVVFTAGRSAAVVNIFIIPVIARRKGNCQRKYSKQGK